MRVSIFKNFFTATGDAGEVIDFNELIKIKMDKNIVGKDKQYLPVLQCHRCPEFLVKKDVITYNLYNYWDGLVFIDLDKPKHGDDICDWWDEENISDKFKKLSNRLCKYMWFVGMGLSSSGRGYHIVGFINSRFKTENEYIATYIKVYDDLWREIKDIFSEYDDKEVKSMLDDHNIFPYQKFGVSNKMFVMNRNFDEELTLDLNEYDNDDEYLINVKNDCDKWIVDKVVNKFDDIKKLRNGDSGDKYVYKNDKYKAGSIKPLMKNDKIGYFNNVYRYMLVKTLKCFFNKEDAMNIALSIYDDHWVPGHDKKAAHDHIIGLIDNEDIFEPKDWFIDVLVSIGVIDKKPVYDKYIDMDELGVDYISDIMPDIMSVDCDVLILESPAASGKTTAIRNIKDSVWLCEPYNPIIKNNFLKDKTNEFQCVYDDKYFDKELMNKKCNKVVSSYNKLLSVDINVFKDNNIKYLFIDESHIIFSDCEFRFKVMIGLVHKIIDLIKIGVKVILMTGTPLKEKELFSLEDNINIKYVKVKRKHKYNKNMIIKKYNTTEDKNFSLSNYIVDDIKKYVDNGYKILVPCNKGDKTIMNMITRMNVKFDYCICDDDFNIYKRQYRDDEYNKNVSEKGDMNTKIMFATKYLSVGVSIYNKEKAAILFFGERFTAYEIEQYACRFRNTDIECVWYINDKFDDGYATNYNTIKVPSENNIKEVISGLESEIKYRGFENWDYIIKSVLNNYNGIIYEDVFNIGKFFYDKWSLNLDWIVKSLNIYYDKFENNLIELEKYGFKINKINIEDDSDKKYMREYKEEINNVNEEIYNKAMRWIDKLDDIYFSNGFIEMDDGEVLNCEPYISLHKFAMFCWYNYISIDDIKDMLRSCFKVEKSNKMNKRIENILNKIEHAEESMKINEERAKTNIKYKSRYDIAVKKYNDAQEELKKVKAKYSYSLKSLKKYRTLIQIFRHEKYGNISELYKFIVGYIKNMYANDNVHILDDIIDDVTDKCNKKINVPNGISYKYYINVLKKIINNILYNMFDIEKIKNQSGIDKIKVNICKFSDINIDWFNGVWNRSINNFGILSETRRMLDK